MKGSLLAIAGLGFILIESEYVFPAYDGRQLVIAVEGDGLKLSDYLLGVKVPWTDLTQLELDKMTNHLYIQFELHQPYNLN
jgi:hypothetical protein